VKTKQLIITGAAGLLSFCAAFAISWFTNPAPPSVSGTEAESKLSTGIEGVLKLPGRRAGIRGTGGMGQSTLKKTMTEQQLRELIYEVRDKIRQYESKLGKQQQRLEMAQDSLKKDIEELNNLRVELASTVERLKHQQDKLLASRVEIAQSEQANLKSIAAAYDRMDSASAGKILTNMCVLVNPKTQQKLFGGKDSNIGDAVKILYYMTERTKGKLLAELVNSEPRLAAILCERLKRIVEKK